jgi:hypothetical protein
VALGVADDRVQVGDTARCDEDEAFLGHRGLHQVRLPDGTVDQRAVEPILQDIPDQLLGRSGDQ